MILPDPSLRGRGFKPDAVAADFAGVGVDKRLVEYWRRQQASRRWPRAAAPAQVPVEAAADDSEAVEGHAVPLAAEERSNVVPMTFEDR